MSQDQEIPTSLKIGVGLGIAYALYRLGLAIGGKKAPAGTSGGDPRKPPPRPRDTKPIEIRVRPSPANPRSAVIEMEGRIISVGDLIARIDAGGRRDVLVTVTGDTRTGAWDEIRDMLAFAGIQISLRT